MCCANPNNFNFAVFAFSICVGTMPNDKPLSFMVFPQLSLEIREFLYKIVLT